MAFIDKSFFRNPLREYFSWLFNKINYHTKNRGSHLRIGYKTRLTNVKFGKYNWVNDNTVLHNVTVGDFTYFSANSVILEASFGKFCSIGPNVKVAPGKHPTHTIVSTHPAIYSNPPYYKKNFSATDKHNPYRHVEIGNDVWIGANAVIADGVKISDGAIVAANALVTKNVEAYSIVSGVPAMHVRYRFTEDEIAALLKERWWDNNIEWLEKNAVYLWDIKDFMQHFATAPNENEKHAQ